MRRPACLYPVVPIVLIGLVFASVVRAEEGAQENRSASQPQKVRWAHIVVRGEYPEGAQAPGLFGDLTESLADAIGRLDQAAGDGDLSGVVLHIKQPRIGWGKLHELREAVRRVRDKGKRVTAFLDSASTMDYLLATACDEVVMPESGVLLMVGLRAEVTFYKNLLEMLDVRADMLRVGEYKSAAEPFTRTEMSQEFRREIEEILDDYWGQMVEMIAEARGLEREAVVLAIDAGPHSAKTARALGLLDHVAYEDQLDELIEGEDGSQRLDLARGYARKKVDTDFSGLTGFIKMMNLMMGVDTTARKTTRSKIAVIHAAGPITTGRSAEDLFGGKSVGSDTLVKAIHEARDDSSVKAVVLRVDSPGGSALASDLIWRALETLDKPLVVSMGDVAASGGYYISMGADTIFAEPGTLTGSIGVVGGKLALRGLFEKVGVTTSVVTRGANSGAMSGLDGYSDSERRAMQKLIEEVYEQFTRKAAEGRKMELDELEKLARGRVYTGAMAVKNGLVDRLGTLEDAIRHAKKLAGMKEDEEVERLVLPKARSPFEALFGPLEPDDVDSGRSPAAGTPVEGRLLRELESLSPELARQLRAAQIIRVLSNEPRLTLMPFRLEVR